MFLSYIEIACSSHVQVQILSSVSIKQAHDGPTLCERITNLFGSTPQLGSYRSESALNYDSTMSQNKN